MLDDGYLKNLMSNSEKKLIGMKWSNINNYSREVKSLILFMEHFVDINQDKQKQIIKAKVIINIAHFDHLR